MEVRVFHNIVLFRQIQLVIVRNGRAYHWLTVRFQLSLFLRR